MKIITGGRGEGNTTLLLLEANNSNSIIICPTHFNKQTLIQMSKDIGIKPPRIFTYQEVKGHSLEGINSTTKICISDFKEILKMAIPDLQLFEIDSVSESI